MNKPYKRLQIQGQCHVKKKKIAYPKEFAADTFNLITEATDSFQANMTHDHRFYTCVIDNWDLVATNPPLVKTIGIKRSHSYLITDTFGAQVTFPMKLAP